MLAEDALKNLPGSFENFRLIGSVEEYSRNGKWVPQ
jgi:hypothetical protein